MNAKFFRAIKLIMGQWCEIMHIFYKKNAKNVNNSYTIRGWWVKVAILAVILVSIHSATFGLLIARLISAISGRYQKQSLVSLL